VLVARSRVVLQKMTSYGTRKFITALTKATILHYTKHCCVISAKNGGIFVFKDCRNENWCYHSWYGITLCY